MARTFGPVPPTAAEARALGLIPELPAGEAMSDEFFEAYAARKPSDDWQPPAEPALTAETHGPVWAEDIKPVEGTPYWEFAHSVQPPRYKPLGSFAPAGDPKNPAQGFGGTVKVRNQVKVADYSMTAWEVWHRPGHGDDLARRPMPVTDAVRDEAERAGLYRDLDAEVAHLLDKPARRKPRGRAIEPDPVAPAARQFSSFEADTARRIDAICSRYGA